MGGSYGGYMVLASLTHFPEQIKCGVDVVGISNFLTFLKNTRITAAFAPGRVHRR